MVTKVVKLGLGTIAFILGASALQAQEIDKNKLADEITKKVEARMQLAKEQIINEITNILDQGMLCENEDAKEKIKAIKSDIKKLGKQVSELKKKEAALKEKLEAEDEEESNDDIKAEIKKVTTKIEKLQKRIGELKKEKVALEKELKPGDDEEDEDLTEEEAQRQFDEYLKLHEAKKFDEAIAGFKKLYKKFQDSDLGISSAYNVACGYALLGKKDEAIEWLQKSIKAGWSNFEHMESDPDLDSLRNDPRYKKIIEENKKEEEEEE